MITTVDWAGRFNAASYGTCTRVHHEPVYLAFTANIDADTVKNVVETNEFVVNIPSFDKESLEAVRVVGLPFAQGVSELDIVVKAPRILECSRHFECRVEWTKEWAGRLMIVGEVMAASANADCVNDEGYILWNRVRPAHYCGAPYGGKFVAAYQTMDVGLPYDGPEVADFYARERAMFKEP
jgi:flavin reductase (DIM6/NTAB) family NADH-FMN oxidoreductase RutF